MNQNGTSDYYLELTKYINQFINKNYTLTQDDMRAILDGQSTDNLTQRQETNKILNEALTEILKNKAEGNKQFIEQLGNGTNPQPLTLEQQTQEIENYKQQLLEKLWEHKQYAQDQNNVEIKEPIQSDMQPEGIQELTDESSDLSQEIEIREPIQNDIQYQGPPTPTNEVFAPSQGIEYERMAKNTKQMAEYKQPLFQKITNNIKKFFQGLYNRTQTHRKEQIKKTDIELKDNSSKDNNFKNSLKVSDEVKAEIIKVGQNFAIKNKNIEKEQRDEEENIK